MLQFGVRAVCYVAIFSNRCQSQARCLYIVVWKLVKRTTMPTHSEQAIRTLNQSNDDECLIVYLCASMVGHTFPKAHIPTYTTYGLSIWATKGPSRSESLELIPKRRLMYIYLYLKPNLGGTILVYDKHDYRNVYPNLAFVSWMQLYKYSPLYTHIYCCRLVAASKSGCD